MARVDFLISNDRHHKAMTWPVVEALAGVGDDHRRVVSLCELRGVRSPAAPPTGAELRKVLPFHIRRSPAVGGLSSAAGLGRRALRAVSWRLLIGPRFAGLLDRRPDLVVMPHDSGFPYDRIARRLHQVEVPFLLLQEGIRFPMPAESAGPHYGGGGAAAVAAWGAASGDYFRQVGVPAERIHLTGSPRFDHLRPPSGDSEKRQARERLGLGPRTLALITNPIDDQGFCSRAEKLDLFARLLRESEPLFADPDLHLAVKPHARERADEYARRIPSALRQRVTVLRDVSLTDLLFACRGAIVMASTVGLEALLCSLPLAVVEIPGHGFQYDYVQSGIAAGLAWDRPVAPQLASLLEPSAERQRRVEAYLENQFAARGDASRRVATLVRELLAGQQ